jgi:hypothetical protein
VFCLKEKDGKLQNEYWGVGGVTTAVSPFGMFTTNQHNSEIKNVHLYFNLKKKTYRLVQMSL